MLNMILYYKKYTIHTVNIKFYLPESVEIPCLFLSIVIFLDQLIKQAQPDFRIEELLYFG